MIDRKLYLSYFTLEDINKWKCPTCRSGLLQVSTDKFMNEYNSETAINYDEDYF
ncbi:MAG: Unknown protein [uncultured Sulfurovum sp.]|uniref:Uncharacterized protein n=1 Tax=uncultured Sulfurovum sp. TaxID=269237 RepID=A0A6S6UES4_9BACT|nr:MAG: Unknown protein [uncultured Sulfurovum sp.]